jgi:predicted neuraminidase
MRRRFAAGRLGCLLLAILFVSHAVFLGQTREFIYRSAPFPSAHASTIVELKNGDFLAAWFGGTAEGNPDVSIWSSRRTAKGWTPLTEIAHEPKVPCWNPVLFHSANGRLWLYYKFGPSYTWWSAARRFSDDDGQTWSAVEHLPAGLLGPIRAKPLVLGNGVILSGTSVESYSSWAAWIERSTDNGQTWTRIGPITLPQLRNSTEPLSTNQPANPIGIIQPVVVALGGQHLRLYARASSTIGKICIADSFDDGLTWSDAHPLDVPNPNSGIDLIRLEDDRIILLYNCQGRSKSGPVWRSKREPLWV